MTAISRATTIVILTLLLLGAYALIAPNYSARGEVTASGKLMLIKPPKNIAGDVQEGTGI